MFAIAILYFISLHPLEILNAKLILKDMSAIEDHD